MNEASSSSEASLVCGICGRPRSKLDGLIGKLEFVALNNNMRFSR